MTPIAAIDWRGYRQAVAKRKWQILALVIAATLLTVVYAVRLPNVYQARAVITTIDQDPQAMGALQSVLGSGGMAGMADLSPFGSSRLTELEQLLRSNIIMEKTIVRNDLLPVLLPDLWDAEKKEWKTGGASGPGALTRALRAVSGLFMPRDPAAMRRQQDDRPTTWDGIAVLESAVKVRSSFRSNSITLTVDWTDPDTAATLATNILETLRDHMADEKKRIADANKEYLEEQLKRAVDPVTRQKIFYLLAKQIETKIMSEVKENAGFKYIDPPRAPQKRLAPNRTRMVLVAFVLSFVIGCYGAIYLEKREAAPG